MSISIETEERLVSEMRRMNAETEKFIAEQRKLISEASKLDRDRWLAPAHLMVTAFAAGAGLVSAIWAIVKWQVGVGG